MALPEGFQFSQGKLQDYVDCPRRFQLRHLLMQPWPALITGQPSETEQHLQRGADLHRLAHQYALGLSPDSLTATIHDPILERWWQTFLAHPPPGLPKRDRYAELVLAASLSGYRLVAKLDLLAVTAGKHLLIVDWKAMLKHPQRQTLAHRLQTRVYRYLVVEAGAAFNGGLRPEPEQVEMVYWFATHDGQSQHFPYDAEQYAADRRYLADLVANIAACQDPVWPLASNERACRFCNYRSLCERGVTAGFLEELDQDLEPEELEIDLEQVIEIAF